MLWWLGGNTFWKSQVHLRTLLKIAGAWESGKSGTVSKYKTSFHIYVGKDKNKNKKQFCAHYSDTLMKWSLLEIIHYFVFSCKSLDLPVLTLKCLSSYRVVQLECVRSRGQALKYSFLIYSSAGFWDQSFKHLCDLLQFPKQSDCGQH